MLPAANPPRKRSWLVPTFSLGTLMWLMLFAGMAAVWWRDRSSLDQRIRKLEQMYDPGPQEPLWSAADILGPPDDLTGTMGKSWCPQRSSAADWVQVGFDKPVAAATIVLHETYSVGCVTEVIVTDGAGKQTSIWKGTDPTPLGASTGLFKVPVPASIKSVKEVRIHVDSTGGRGSWACIDAVGLTTGSGKTTWATSASASSVYGGTSLTAEIKKKPWFSLW
jgi:hypothetical protein